MQVRFPVLAVAASLLSACIVELPSGQLPPSLDDRQPVFTQGTAGRNPIIQSFTANPSNVTKGQPITFQVVASDPDRNPLQLNWSATDGTLSTNTGQVVSWIPPEKPGVYSVTVTVANGRGGLVTGTQNLTVQENGSAVIGGKPPSEAPTISPVPTALPSVSLLPSVQPSRDVTPSSPLPSASGSLVPSPVASVAPRFQLDGFTVEDVDIYQPLHGASPPAYLSNEITFQAVSASKKRYNMSLSPVDYQRGWTGVTFGALAADGKSRVTYHPPDVYVLTFSEAITGGTPGPGSPDFPVKHDLYLPKAGVSGAVFLSPTPVAIDRANWRQPPDAPAANKRYDGTSYVFQYDGKGLDLGTFNLP